jgi:hypothetical protein
VDPACPRGRSENFIYLFIFFWSLLPAGKMKKKIFGFQFSIPEFPVLRGRSREKKKVFSA